MNIFVNSKGEEHAAEIETKLNKQLDSLQMLDELSPSEKNSKVLEKVESDDSKMSKAEKRSRQILSKLSLELVPGISQVVMRKKPDLAIVFNKPEVYRYKNAHSDNYVIFGKYEIRNLGLLPGYQTIQNCSESTVEYLLNPNCGKYASEGNVVSSTALSVDENDLGQGISEGDVEVVMNQSGCTKSAAIKALREADGDLVNAILSVCN